MFDLTNAAEPLLLVGQPSVDATLLAVTENGTFRFQVFDQPQEVTAKQLIRWSNPISNFAASEIYLSDGSRLALAESWTGKQSWEPTGATLSATTKRFGKISVPLDKLRAICLHLPAEPRKRTKFYDEVKDSSSADDRLFLANGDQLNGKFHGLVNSDKGQQIEFRVGTSAQPLLILPTHVAAIVFADPGRNFDSAKLIVGTRDGSSLSSMSLVADESLFRVSLACGIELTGSDYRDITQLRSLNAECCYVSDLAPTDYRHVPYLEIPWRYRLDRNVLAGPLQTSGHIYSKGIGMMTASRLSYRLDEPEIEDRYSRFVASLAIDDEASGGGSVIFRVYLRRDEKWQLAYTSPVVRGNDDPVPIAVELKKATQIMLVTDYADRGDERDYANWLDARLE